MKRGLVVGRFQPYHLGHHEAIKNVLKEVDELVIIIGSTNKSYTKDNPFTCGERIEMMGRALKADNVFEKCYIVPVPDIDEYALWVSRVQKHAPKFDFVFSNNPLVKQLFEDENIKVRPMVSNIKEVESRLVREELMNHGSWENILPKAVAQFLKEIKALERMKMITQGEHKG